MVRCRLALRQKKVPASLTWWHFLRSPKFVCTVAQYLPAASNSSDTLTPGAGSKTAIGRSIPIYYRKRGSASYIVRQWLLWEGERERERDACDVIWYHAEIASDHAYDYLDGASTQRVEFWACRVLECMSTRSARRQGAWRLSARAAGSIVCWMTMGKCKVEALRSLVSMPWITQYHFVDMLQARKIDQVDVYFLFEWQRFCLWEQLG